MSRLTVEALSPANRADWDAFVAASPDATFFHRSGWMRSVEEAYGHVPRGLLARRDGRVAGVLPLMEVRTLLAGHALVSTPFAVEGGIAADDADAAAALARAAEELGRERGAAHLELRGPGPQAAADTGEGWAERTDRYAVFRRPISPDHDANLKAIPRKKRADVRKGLGGHLTVELTDEVEVFWQIYADSVRRLGTPVFPRRWFQTLRDTFPAETEIALVHGPDGPVAALMSFYHGDRVLPYYGGALPAARDLHAYDHMYWSLMARAAERGAREFDFGRSKVGTGAFAYKTHWGFEPTHLTYRYRLLSKGEVPDVNPNNPKYRRFVEIWKRLPSPLANRLGPMLARHLG